MSIKTALIALAVARSSEADEAILAVYLRSLDDLDPTHVRRACERLGPSLDPLPNGVVDCWGGEK